MKNQEPGISPCHRNDNVRVVVRSFRRSGSSDGFLLMDCLIAAAVIFCGLGALVNLMPQMMTMSQRQSVTSEIADYGLAKQQDMLTDTYTNILPSATSSPSDDFQTLLGPGATSASKYSWNYTSTEEIPNVLKKVTLYIKYSDGGTVQTLGPWIFWISDMNDVVQ